LLRLLQQTSVCIVASIELSTTADGVGELFEEVICRRREEPTDGEFDHGLDLVFE